ncbi:hypothetical protein TcWFU_007477 [Taenia crassiceps]|uniref:Secreted protein n=1 Tax=Taenia crassiceps TaxID=6207 RepID=A0ABR4QS92_9CEST
MKHDVLLLLSLPFQNHSINTSQCITRMLSMVAERPLNSPDICAPSVERKFLTSVLKEPAVCRRYGRETTQMTCLHSQSASRPHLYGHSTERSARRPHQCDVIDFFCGGVQVSSKACIDAQIKA